MPNFVVTLSTKGRELEAQQLLYGYGFKVEFYSLGAGGHDPGNPNIALPIDPDVTDLPSQFFGPQPIDIADLISPTCPRFTCIVQPGDAVGGISNLGLIATILYVPGQSFAVLPSAIDITNDWIIKALHGLTSGKAVTFSSTGVLPTGLSVSTNYYVRDVTSSTFRVSLTSGGPPIDFGSQGIGTHSIIYGTIPGAPIPGTQFLYALTNFPLRVKLASSRETFTITIRT